MRKSGQKSDAGKARFDLIDPQFIASLARVLTHGADMHGGFNWRRVKPTRFIAALGRHVNAFLRGEFWDPETGEPHVVHAAANLMFLFYFFTPKGGRNNEALSVSGNGNPSDPAHTGAVKDNQAGL